MIDYSGAACGQKTKVLVLHIDVYSADRKYTPDYCLEEALGLARAISLDILHAEIIPLKKVTPSTMIGSGSVERIKKIIDDLSLELVVVNAKLTPIQQRTLERRWSVKVIDRVGLIIEIFGARAQTAEGTLQVELAALSYQRSRLVRSWTHLERQRGGFGFTGGPGEKQIEMDRRLIDERIIRIKRDLEKVRKTRGLHRQARKKVPYPVVALVGYTNAGKSTLFNRLTNASVFAEDLLFATLDPTMRRLELPVGKTIILSDTVGFISDLPTPLITAFRATLEEVCEADLILHIRDSAHEESDQQAQDVYHVLEELGLSVAQEVKMIEVYNKIDLLDEEQRHFLGSDTKNSVCVSALTGEGVDVLLEKIGQMLSWAETVYIFRIPHTQGAPLAWLYEHGEVLERMNEEDYLRIRVRLNQSSYDRFVKAYSMKVSES